MAKLTWDDQGKKFYKTGVDRGVLYPLEGTTYEQGYAWNGLRSVNETPSGGEPTDLYANNAKYATLMSTEGLAITIGAYTYPDEFAPCNGEAAPTGVTGVTLGQQTRQPFGFAYRTLLGNDTQGTDAGYELHLVYNLLASPSEVSNETVNDSPAAAELSWECTSTPVACTGHKPVCKITIDSRTADPTKLAELEKALYGDVSTEAKLPLPDEVITMMTPGE